MSALFSINSPVGDSHSRKPRHVIQHDSHEEKLGKWLFLLILLISMGIDLFKWGGICDEDLRERL